MHQKPLTGFTLRIGAIHEAPKQLSFTFCSIFFKLDRLSKMQLDVGESTPASDMIYRFHSSITFDNCHQAYDQSRMQYFMRSDLTSSLIFGKVTD